MFRSVPVKDDIEFSGEEAVDILDAAEYNSVAICGNGVEVENFYIGFENFKNMRLPGRCRSTIDCGYPGSRETRYSGNWISGVGLPVP